jgi:hypothetical protein
VARRMWALSLNRVVKTDATRVLGVGSNIDREKTFAERCMRWKSSMVMF